MGLPIAFVPIVAFWNDGWCAGTYDGNGVWTLEFEQTETDYQAVPTKEITDWYYLNSQ